MPELVRGLYLLLGRLDQSGARTHVVHPRRHSPQYCQTNDKQHVQDLNLNWIAQVACVA